jgi:hypothetical protein
VRKLSFFRLVNFASFSDDCNGDPACIMNLLQEQGLLGGSDKKEPNPNEGRNFQVKRIETL